MKFKGRLEDLVRKEVLAEFPCIRAPCHRQARVIACRLLKRRKIYKEREDVREFVRVMENMEGVDTAGYEFDVLPEEFRRYVLTIIPICKKE